MKYIALLRGINVGGKNTVPMPMLKKTFEDHGFLNVRTYINSGNVIFDADSIDSNEIRLSCEQLILTTFGIISKVYLITSLNLLDALDNAPLWWDHDLESKHNAIFVIPPMTPTTACQAIGETTPALEQIATWGSVIFWSAPLSTFSRTRWATVVKNKDVYHHITIRNARTTKKLGSLVRLAITS